MDVACSAGGEAERCEDEQRQKEEQKEDLRDSAKQRQSGMGQGTPPHAARGRLFVLRIMGGFSGAGR